MESTGTKYGRQLSKLVQSSVSSSSGPSCIPFSGITDYFNDDVGGGFGFYRGDVERITTTYIPFFFTPVQWQELKRQALIYKHLVSAVPIPVDLLLYDSTAAARHLYPTPSTIPEEAVGRTHRFKNKPDSEPGRCRRTDGKKWRCSKDVAPDQKYCERHMHRGRARSKKPVEQPPREKLTTADISTEITSQGSRCMDWMRIGTGGDGDSSDRKRSHCSEDFVEKPTKAENVSSSPSDLTLSISSMATVADPDSSTSTATPQLIQMGVGFINNGIERATHPLGGPLGEVFHSVTSTSFPRRDDVSSPVHLNT